MSRNRYIKITITPDGTTTVDAIGFRGQGCKSATLEITAVLGGQVNHQRDKPEARLRESNRQGEQEGAR